MYNLHIFALQVSAFHQPVDFGTFHGKKVLSRNSNKYLLNHTTKIEKQDFEF